MLDSDIIKNVNDLYSFLAMLVMSTVYVITVVSNRKLQKKDQFELVNNLQEQNNRLITKLEELKETRNSLDLQSTMDIIYVVYTKSMLKVQEGVRVIMEEGYVKEQSRKELIHSKVKSLVNTHYDDDMISLGRIYYKNIKLSYYLSELDRYELIDTIYNKVVELQDKKYMMDLMDYIRSKYQHSIQAAQIQISK